jgi:molybdate transport system substrate-binding protein
VEKKLVPAENVRAALALLTSGNVDAALVAAPLVARGAQSERLEAVLVDSELHGPLDQTVIACSERPEAGAIVELFASDEARAVFAAHGFDAPFAVPAGRRDETH